jgi:hypothetical protein
VTSPVVCSSGATHPTQLCRCVRQVWLGVRFILECDYFTGRVLEIDGGLVR